MNSLEFIENEIKFLEDMISMDLALMEDEEDLEDIAKKQKHLAHLHQIKSELEAWRDKSTPKMFKIKKDTDGKIIYVCPNCGRVLVKFWNKVETITMYNYCDNCGQALKYME